MKTLKIILLCFIAALAVNTVKAQNSVIKEDIPVSFCGPDQYIPCTGDYMCGTVTAHLITTNNNSILRFKNEVVAGYKDPEGQEPSGNYYEITEVYPGINSMENHLLFRVNGKLIAEAFIHWHMTTNANGDITAVIDKGVINCKK